MKRLLKSIIGWGLLLVACLFFQQMNSHAVPIYLYSRDQGGTVFPAGHFAEVPLCWIVFASLALGAILALAYSLGPLRRAEQSDAAARAAAARLKKKLRQRIQELEAELASASDLKAEVTPEQPEESAEGEPSAPGDKAPRAPEQPAAAGPDQATAKQEAKGTDAAADDEAGI